MIHIILNPEYFLLENILNDGKFFYELARYSDALLFFDFVLIIDSKALLAWIYSGMALMHLESYKDSLICFDLVIK
jgi:hypothetical protein